MLLFGKNGFPDSRKGFERNKWNANDSDSLERLKLSKRIDEVVVAIIKLIQITHWSIFLNQNYLYARGRRNKCSWRGIKAAEEFKADIVVRITGDCPIIDPMLVDS